MAELNQHPQYQQYQGVNVSSFLNAFRRTWVAATNILNSLLGLLFVIFLFLKLSSIITWPWIWVVLPLNLAYFNTFVATIYWIISFNHSFSVFMLTGFFMPLSFICSILLVAFRLDNVISSTYTLLLLPVDIMTLIIIIFDIVKACLHIQPSSPIITQMNTQTFTNITLVAFMIGLKVDYNSYTWGWALFFPWLFAVFSLIGFLFLSCGFCSFCCFYSSLMSQLQSIANFGETLYIRVPGLGTISKKIGIIIYIVGIIVCYLILAFYFTVVLLTHLYLANGKTYLFSSIFGLLIFVFTFFFITNIIITILFRYLFINENEVSPDQIFNFNQSGMPTPKCPLCRKEITGVVELSGTKVIRQLGGQYHTGDLFSLVQMTPTFFRQLSSSSSTTSCKSETEPLMSRQSSIKPDNVEKARSHFQKSDSTIKCYVCENNDGDSVLLDCGHSGICYDCGCRIYNGEAIYDVDNLV